MNRDEALEHFRKGIGRMVRYLERAGVLQKPRIRAEIMSTTESDIHIRLIVPRQIIPDLAVLMPDDLIGMIAIDTQDLDVASGVTTSDLPIVGEEDE